MKRVLLAYFAVLLGFLLLDGLWLGLLMGPTYKALLGPLMLEQPVWAPALIFYLLYAVGVVVFVVLPSAREGRWQRAAILGALFGLVAYGTYDLSNWATLQGWSPTLVCIDMAWGSLVTSAVSLTGYCAIRRFS